MLNEILDPKVSIVIVCMNNLNNLIPCLDSINKFTRISHDIWVNAYMFSYENLEIAQKKYPYVHWIVNNKIAGFSENNNMILSKLNSEYVLVLNDDTEFKEPVLDELVNSFEKTKDATIMSPHLFYGDGNTQMCGRPSYNWFEFLLYVSGIYNPEKKKSIYTYQKGIFQTYNISGAAFLIKTKIFKDLGFFDDYYFFTPEDIALSTLVNKLQGKCFVDADIHLTHYAQQTSSRVKEATLPAARKGGIHFHSSNNRVLYYLLALSIFFLCILKSIYCFIRNDIIGMRAQWHCVETILSSMSPKEIFTLYYNRLNK